MATKEDSDNYEEYFRDYFEEKEKYYKEMFEEKE